MYLCICNQISEADLEDTPELEHLIGSNCGVCLTEVCVACGKGFLSEKYEDNLFYSVCSYCKGEYANAEQLRKNVENR